MLDKSPLESLDFPGFYEIPGYSQYVISKEGKVVSKTTGKMLTESFLEKGYCLFTMNDDAGVRGGIGRHRLLGIVFKNPGRSTEGLVINHLNGVPGDDRLDNLEWTTYQGNAEHAGANGLTSKCIPISVRDARTGEVKTYPSCTEYAREVGWTKDKVIWRVKVGEGRVFPEGKQYRPASQTGPWFIPEDVDLSVLMNTRSRITLVRDVFTGTVKEYPSLSEAARDLRVSKATLSNWIWKKAMPVLPGFIQVKFSHDPRPWRPVSDPYLELQISLDSKIVRVTEEKTGNHTYFTSIVECGKKMGLSPTALSYRLKSKAQTVFSDGFRYAYYSDVLQM